jgi:hypothetical protein
MSESGGATRSCSRNSTFIFLQLADFATTMTALQMGGREKNFLVSHIMVIGSLQGLVLPE